MPGIDQAIIELGLSEKDSQEITEIALVIASRMDIAIQNRVEDACVSRQAMNKETVRLAICSVMLSWAAEDASWDYGWATKNVDTYTFSGRLLQQSMRYISRRRVDRTGEKE